MLNCLGKRGCGMDERLTMKWGGAGILTDSVTHTVGLASGSYLRAGASLVDPPSNKPKQSVAIRFDSPVEGWQACCNLQVPSAHPLKRAFWRLPGGLGPRFPDVLPGIESIGNRTFESRFSKSRLPALSGRASGVAALLALGTFEGSGLFSLAHCG
jgi:hypothetical protein